MPIMVKAVLIAAASCGQIAFTPVVCPAAAVERVNLAPGSVTASGSTYDAAYQAALKKLPAGSHVTGAQGQQGGGRWTVTIIYS